MLRIGVVISGRDEGWKDFDGGEGGLGNFGELLKGR